MAKKLRKVKMPSVIEDIAKELNIPIKYIGTGEGIDDFAVFNAQDFVDGMFE